MKNKLRQAMVLSGYFTQFFHHAACSGVVLLLFALVAMVLANSPWVGIYESVLHMPLRIVGLELSVLHWINDGLMAIFFFVIGLEIKREFLYGELHSLSAMALPIVAALGGMVMPAVLYGLVNFGSPTIVGWGIPMATDIAFSLGLLAIAASKAPRGVAVFLTTLAIVDDLGAIIIIAAFYNTSLSVSMLFVGLMLFGFLFILNRRGVTWFLPYLLIGLMAWYCFLLSGIHPTIAGVLLGLLIPASGDSNRSLLHQLERRIHPWSTYVIMPIFALANAGLPLGDIQLREFISPVTLGIIVGLCIGKPLGILGSSYLLCKAGFAVLPDRVRPSQMAGAGVLGGIGFTMSLFIASLAFESPAYLAEAKLGVLTASIFAGFAGVAVFTVIGKPTGHSKRQGSCGFGIDE